MKAARRMIFRQYLLYKIFDWRKTNLFNYLKLHQVDGVFFVSFPHPFFVRILGI